MKLARSDWLLVVLAVAFAAVCVRLGVWQLDRLGQRKARNARIVAARLQPAVELTGAVPAESLAGRPVVARGVYEYAHERVWPARSLDAAPGVAILTPLRLDDGALVFVDRGWAYAPDGSHVDFGAYREADTVTVLGIALAAPRSRGDVNPARLRDSLGTLLPVVIRQLPGAGAPRLRRWPEERLTNGPHLGYAVQWFSFAVIALAGTVTLLRSTSGSGRSSPPGSPAA